MSLRPVYVRIESEDFDGTSPWTYDVSPVPFLTCYGDDIRPTKAEKKTATSYAGLCTILSEEFQIPDHLLPPAKYFKPTRGERDQGESNIYRNVPEGMGEAEWKTKARNAILWELEESDCFSDKGKVSVNDKHCYSLEELRDELEIVAERAGGKKRIAGEAYQPDYDALVKEVLEGYATLLGYIGLPQSRKRVR